MPNMKSFVIVGAGMAGARAAESLRNKGFDDRIFLVGDEGRLPYERPPLSKECLVGSKPLDTTTIREWDQWMELAVHLVLNDPVATLDTAGGAVRLASGIEIKADKVLLATGGRANVLDVAGADLPGIHTLRTAVDADALGDRLRRGRAKVAVIGGGLLAIEVASAAATLGNDVTWMVRSRHPLTAAVGAHAADNLAGRYATSDITIMTSVAVAGFEGRNKVQGVALDDGRIIEADIVLVAIGQSPAAGYLDRSVIDTRHGVQVDGRLETTVPGVFAAGDLASFVDPFIGGRVRHGTWLNAQQQGDYVAGAMMGEPEPFRSVPWYWSDHHDLNVQVVGRIDETANIVTRVHSDDSVSYFYLAGSTIVGAVGINAARDVRGAMLLMEKGTGIDAVALEDITTDVRRMGAKVAAL